MFLSQFVCPRVGSITCLVTPGDSEALQVQLVVIPECGCLPGVGTLLTRVLRRGLLLRTAWASNSCDKCSSHGDGGRFSQTNNGRMFICGSPHLGRSACLPLSLDRGIGVCVLPFFSAVLFVFSSPLPGFTSLTCFLAYSVVYFTDEHTKALC